MRFLRNGLLALTINARDPGEGIDEPEAGKILVEQKTIHSGEVFCPILVFIRLSLLRNL